MAVAAAMMSAVYAGTAGAAGVYTGTYVDMYLKQNTFPGGLSEAQVFLDAAMSSTITGHVGSQAGTPLVMFSSATDTLDASNGFATIKAADGAINNVTITAPGYWFDDLIFGVQLTGSDATLEVTATDKTGGVDTYAGWTGQGGWVPGLNDILVLSTGGNLMKSVTINSAGGMASLEGLVGADQVKHFEISGLTPVPVPAAVWLFGSGLIGLVSVARRKATV